jgi:hypothetical protein
MSYGFSSIVSVFIGLTVFIVAIIVFIVATFIFVPFHDNALIWPRHVRLAMLALVVRLALASHRRVIVSKVVPDVEVRVAFTLDIIWLTESAQGVPHRDNVAPTCLSARRHHESGGMSRSASV